MRSLPSHKPNKPKSEQARAKIPPPVQVISLVAILGLLLSALQFGHLAVTPKQAVSPTATTVRMENNREEGASFHVFWSIPVTNAQFWFDNTSTTADCDERNCTVPKRQGIRQIYFRWLDSSDNQWYYFQCSGDYQGQFKGIPYAR
jgi:hypothetical protein